jgi:O-methyltransferase
VLFDIGLPKAADAQHRVGGFSDTSYDRVRARAAALGVTEQLKIVPGRFSDVFRTWNQRPFSFAHLDCDLHDSYQDCLHYFYPRMSPGGVILFDEYDDAAWPGCNLAVDAFLADKPEKLQTIEMNNHIKAYVVKLPRGR